MKNIFRKNFPSAFVLETQKELLIVDRLLKSTHLIINPKSPKENEEI